MRLPEIPASKQFRRLTPTLYESALACKARARWAAFGTPNAVPQHPRALLGSSVHAVVEAAQKGQLASDAEDCRRLARNHFDETARKYYEGSHPLLRAKFSTPERLPYYNLFRERAVLLALNAAQLRQASTPGAASQRPQSSGTPQERLAEVWLESPDGLLAGRADYVDTAAGEVVDYKTASAPDDQGGISESEVRQLRLYVHLGLASGMKLNRGVIVRPDGRRATLKISENEAAAEGQKARETLNLLNGDVVRSFADVAEPAPTNCRNCACIPFCEPFWNKASSEWAEQCGSHTEGRVDNITRSTAQGMPLLTLDITIERGTVPPGRGVVQQLPESWALADATSAPHAGDLIRLVNCRAGTPQDGMTLVRPDRVASAVWTVLGSTTSTPTRRP